MILADRCGPVTRTHSIPVSMCFSRNGHTPELIFPCSSAQPIGRYASTRSPETPQPSPLLWLCVLNREPLLTRGVALLWLVNAGGLRV
jgi:hypothetical protein